jgi:hypothetical protein
LFQKKALGDQAVRMEDVVAAIEEFRCPVRSRHAGLLQCRLNAILDVEAIQNGRES